MVSPSMEFRKSLAKFYHGWFRDAHNSVIYCTERGQTELANQYLASAKAIFEIIINNWEAVEFFSVGDRAFLYDGALPKEFRGYK